MVRRIRVPKIPDTLTNEVLAQMGHLMGTIDPVEGMVKWFINTYPSFIVQEDLLPYPYSKVIEGVAARVRKHQGEIPVDVLSEEEADVLSNYYQRKIHLLYAVGARLASRVQS